MSLTIFLLLVSLASITKQVDVGFGVLEVPNSCEVKHEWGGYDAWFGDVRCPQTKLSFYLEGGPVLPLIGASSRKAYKSFSQETLLDGNILTYGSSVQKGETKIYASVCPPEKEFCCGTFVLTSRDEALQKFFLQIVREFKLDPSCGFKKKQGSTSQSVFQN